MNFLSTLAQISMPENGFAPACPAVCTNVYFVELTALGLLAGTVSIVYFTLFFMNRSLQRMRTSAKLLRILPAVVLLLVFVVYGFKVYHNSCASDCLPDNSVQLTFQLLPDNWSLQIPFSSRF